MKILHLLLPVIAISLLFQTNILLAKEKEEKSNNGNKTAVVGNVQKVDKDSVTVDEKKDNKAVKTTIDKNTTVVGKNNKTLNIKDLKKQDKVAIVTTDVEATTGGKLKKAVKVYVKTASESAQSKRQAIQGIIKAVNGTTITLAHQVQQDRVSEIGISSSTTVKMKDVPTATIADLKVGMRIIAMGDLATQGGIVAKRIHVIPGKANGLQKFQTTPDNPATESGDTATGSASPSPTPSTSPVATSSASPSPTASSSGALN